MKSSKKLLSFFLAVVMVFSTLTVMVSAYTVADDVEKGINYKYTVEKVDLVPETDDSEEYEADNLYAVSLWMKSSLGVDIINTTLHYNKALFAPIAIVEDGETSPYGAGIVDNFYTERDADASVYAYSFGDFMNNTDMYDENGEIVSKKTKAACIGLGNSNAPAIETTIQYISPDHPNYEKNTASLTADTGLMSIWLSVNGNKKSAYFNTIEGIHYSTDWNKMVTLYFETISEADVAGAEFGVFTADAIVDGNVDSSGKGYRDEASYQEMVPEALNISGNAKIEAAAYDIYYKQTQRRVNGEAFDIGVKFAFKNIDIQFNDKGTSTNVDRVGADVYKKIDGEWVKAEGSFESPYVYLIGDEYQYRVILKARTVADTADYKIVPYAVYTDTSLEPVYGEEVIVNPSEFLAK